MEDCHDVAGVFNVDKPCSGGRDNTGLTGIRLHCISPVRALHDVHEDYSSVRSEVGMGSDSE